MKIDGRLTPTVERWKAKEKTPKREFKAILRKFLRSYSFITQMVALGDKDLHRLFVYGGFLVKKLFLDTGDTPDLRNKVKLGYLRIGDKGTQAIKLQSEQLHNGGANAGIAKEEDEDFVAKARTNSMGDLKAIFGTVMMDALAAIFFDSQGMLEKSRENPGAFTRVMDGELLPIVYRRCNAYVQ